MAKDGLSYVQLTAKLSGSSQMLISFTACKPPHLQNTKSLLLTLQPTCTQELEAYKPYLLASLYMPSMLSKCTPSSALPGALLCHAGMLLTCMLETPQ